MQAGEHQKDDRERDQRDDTEFGYWHKVRGKMVPIFPLSAASAGKNGTLTA
jgi:hypothetical protein